mmetsp:Transcript_56820/g.173009  ORF Transcript_56820/g.173009 Transcript_56820/m.173009 type:complete len:279 (-) Transcript_56820:941-1777(-)
MQRPGQGGAVFQLRELGPGGGANGDGDVRLHHLGDGLPHVRPRPHDRPAGRRAARAHARHAAQRDGEDKRLGGQRRGRAWRAEGHPAGGVRVGRARGRDVLAGAFVREAVDDLEDRLAGQGRRRFDHGSHGQRESRRYRRHDGDAQEGPPENEIEPSRGGQGPVLGLGRWHGPRRDLSPRLLEHACPRQRQRGAAVHGDAHLFRLGARRVHGVEVHVAREVPSLREDGHGRVHRLALPQRAARRRRPALRLQAALRHVKQALGRRRRDLRLDGGRPVP